MRTLRTRTDQLDYLNKDKDSQVNNDVTDHHYNEDETGDGEHQSYNQILATDNMLIAYIRPLENPCDVKQKETCPSYLPCAYGKLDAFTLYTEFISLVLEFLCLS